MQRSSWETGIRGMGFALPGRREKAQCTGELVLTPNRSCLKVLTPENEEIRLKLGVKSCWYFDCLNSQYSFVFQIHI